MHRRPHDSAGGYFLRFLQMIFRWASNELPNRHSQFGQSINLYTTYVVRNKQIHPDRVNNTSQHNSYLLSRRHSLTEPIIDPTTSISYSERGDTSSTIPSSLSLPSRLALHLQDPFPFDHSINLPHSHEPTSSYAITSIPQNIQL
jgi:hypothetical protein